MHYRRYKLYGDPLFTKVDQRRHFEKSTIWFVEDYAEVELTQNKFALVDYFDTKFVADYAWNFSNSTGYAYNGIVDTSMQQFLVGRAPEGLLIDHIDRNKLNNRRDNLRFITVKENNRNTDRVERSPKVAFHKASGRYQAWIEFNSRPLYLGLYDTVWEGKQDVIAATALAKEHIEYDKLKTSWKLMRRQRPDTEKQDE